MVMDTQIPYILMKIDAQGSFQFRFPLREICKRGWRSDDFFLLFDAFSSACALRTFLGVPA